MQVLRAIARFVPLLGLLISSVPAQAQVVQLSQLQTNLQVAVCQNDWDDALQAIAPLIGSPGIADSYRRELIRFRMHLEGWRAAQSAFTGIAGCEGVIRVTPVLAPVAPRRLDWERAVESLPLP